MRLYLELNKTIMMKKMVWAVGTVIVLLTGCSSDSDNETTTVTTALTFVHTWDGDVVLSSDFNNFQYTTAAGDLLSIERLRYVVSDIRFTSSTGEDIILDIHNLVDVTNDNNLSFTPDIALPSGTYEVSFTFGLDNEDNAENYPDLNSASFNVPDMLGGGYHYMQFDGKFINATMEEQGFNYHAIRAVDNPGPNPTFPQDTFFEVNLGPLDLSMDSEIRIAMNIAEWFKTPHLWDLNTLNQTLMPNATAQIMMFDNGQNVFSLEQVLQYITN